MSPVPSLSNRLALALGLSAQLAIGCDSPSTPQPSDRLPLPALSLPDLQCRSAPEQVGECTRDGDCGQAERCTLDESTEPSDRAPFSLRCGMPLGVGRNRDRCGQGADCESGLCALAGVCLAPCRSNDDCQRGQSCMQVEARSGEGMLSPLQACARVAAFRADVQLAIGAPQPLMAGRLNRLPVDVSNQDALLFVKAECGRTLRVQRLVERASERVLFDIAALLDGQIQPNPVINAGALLPILIPENPRLQLVSSGYDLGLTIDQSSDVRVISAVGAGNHHILDLNVFYVGGGASFLEGGLRPGDPAFQEVLARLADRYEAIGIELGSVREYDVVGALRAELSELEVHDQTDASGNFSDQVVEDLDQLFELSAGVDDGGLNLFVVSKMGPVLGISGGAPGALGLHGSAASGVAIALDTVGLATADRVLFHETGHQMGLFHTSESDGFVLEPLSDTPICSADQDRDQDGILRTPECLGHGADNLMFWEGAGDTLSPQQIELLQRSLVLR